MLACTLLVLVFRLPMYFDNVVSDDVLDDQLPREEEYDELPKR